MNVWRISMISLLLRMFLRWSRSRTGASLTETSSWTPWRNMGTRARLVRTTMCLVLCWRKRKMGGLCTPLWRGRFCIYTTLWSRGWMWCPVWTFCSIWSPELSIFYLVASTYCQSEITVVMNEKNEDTDEPLIGEVAEDNEESGESMMKAILEEVALWPDKEVAKESTEVLAELNDVEDFHLQSFILQFWENAQGCIWGTCSSEPCGHEASWDEDLVGPDRAEKIVQTGVSPFDKSVRSLFFGLWFGISLFGYVVLFA